MKSLPSILGYAAAGLALLAAVATPFVLQPAFQRGIASLGIRPNPVYAGGAVARTVDRGAWRIAFHEPVRAQAPLQRMEPFVQVSFEPASALPRRVSEELDLDGDGRPDVAVAFDVPADPKAPLAADVRSLGGLVTVSRSIGKESIGLLIARVGPKVVLRVPLAQGPRA